MPRNEIIGILHILLVVFFLLLNNALHAFDAALPSLLLTQHIQLAPNFYPEGYFDIARFILSCEVGELPR